MKISGLLLAMLAACLCLPQSAQAGRRFAVVAKPTLGFTIQGGTGCRLGQPMAECLAIVGHSDQTIVYEHKDNTKAYLNETGVSYRYCDDGMDMSADNEGKVLTVTFYVNGTEHAQATGTGTGDGSELLASKPAKVKTEKGIGRGFSLKQLVKAYGHPYKFSKSSLLEHEYWEAYYLYGDELLCFTFKDGVLDKIGMHAKYLPYL